MFKMCKIFSILVLCCLVLSVLAKGPKRTHKVHMEIKMGDEIQNVTFDLFGKTVPKTVENFIWLCENKFNGIIFHRIIKDFMIQGGDFEKGDGTGGFSKFGPKFDDENFKLKHKKFGILSMANSGKNTNGAQFFITTANTNWLDGKHVVFGALSDDKERAFLEKINLVKTDGNDKPIVDVILNKAYVEELPEDEMVNVEL